MDENSRYEVDALIKEETADNKIRLIENKLIQWAGPMQVLRLDASGAHTSDKYTQWAESRGIRLCVITRDGHHHLGILKRNNQVRREQLSIYQAAHLKEDVGGHVSAAQPAPEREGLLTSTGSFRVGDT